LAFRAPGDPPPPDPHGQVRKVEVQRLCGSIPADVRCFPAHVRIHPGVRRTPERGLDVRTQRASVHRTAAPRPGRPHHGPDLQLRGLRAWNCLRGGVVRARSAEPKVAGSSPRAGFCASRPVGRDVRAADGAPTRTAGVQSSAAPGRVRSTHDRRAAVRSAGHRNACIRSAGGSESRSPECGAPECARPQGRRLGVQKSGACRRPHRAARPSARGADLRGAQGREPGVRTPHARGVRTSGVRKAGEPECRASARPHSARPPCGRPHSTCPALRPSGHPPSAGAAVRSFGPGGRGGRPQSPHPPREASCPEPRGRTPAWRSGQGPRVRMSGRGATPGPEQPQPPSVREDLMA
jgi:hypothetical protein